MREKAVESKVGGDVNLAEQVWRNAAADADGVQFVRPDPDPGRGRSGAPRAEARCR